MFVETLAQMFCEWYLRFRDPRAILPGTLYIIDGFSNGKTHQEVEFHSDHTPVSAILTFP